MDGIVLEPLAHAIVSQWHRDEHGQGDEFYKVAGKQGPEIDDAGAEHLADTDLLCTLFGDERSQAEESKTGDEDGETRKDRGEVADAGFRDVFLLEIFVVEAIDKRAGRVILFEYGFHR